MRHPKESHKEGRGAPTTHITKSRNDSHICNPHRRELSHYLWRPSRGTACLRGRGRFSQRVA
eukprot:3168329-Pyramimonas_sp.AAC.1